MNETFFDPETGIDGIPEFTLLRVGPGRFRMLSRIGYRHPKYPGAPIVVPRADRMDTYSTDLTSIPAMFAWLVPVIGEHLPAALLHDGTISQGEKEHEGPDLTREEADDLFRDAMGLSGTPRLRRWLIWTGVSLGTMWEFRTPRSLWRTLMVAYFVVLAALGIVATLDLFDVPWDWARLPWMGDRPWYAELATGAVAAVTVPSVLSLAWGNRRTVGRVAGIAFAFVLHPTLLVLAVTVIYLIAERLMSRDESHQPAT